MDDDKPLAVCAPYNVGGMSLGMKDFVIDILRICDHKEEANLLFYNIARGIISRSNVYYPLCNTIVSNIIDDDDLITRPLLYGFISRDCYLNSIYQRYPDSRITPISVFANIIKQLSDLALQLQSKELFFLTYTDPLEISVGDKINTSIDSLIFAGYNVKVFEFRLDIASNDVCLTSPVIYAITGHKGIKLDKVLEDHDIYDEERLIIDRDGIYTKITSMEMTLNTIQLKCSMLALDISPLIVKKIYSYLRDNNLFHNENAKIERYIIGKEKKSATLLRIPFIFDVKKKGKIPLLLTKHEKYPSYILNEVMYCYYLGFPNKWMDISDKLLLN